MSIFGTIMAKIFHQGDTAAPPAAAPAAAPAPAPPSMTAAASPAPPSVAAPPAQDTTSPIAVATAPAAPPASVDVAAVLDGLAAKSSQRLDWKHSIVDMMKLLDLDSSLTARKALAQELHFSGDMNDSASMNIWLHQQVMQKLADNGGKVPADLQT